MDRFIPLFWAGFAVAGAGLMLHHYLGTAAGLAFAYFWAGALVGGFAHSFLHQDDRDSDTLILAQQVRELQAMVVRYRTRVLELEATTTDHVS